MQTRLKRDELIEHLLEAGRQPLYWQQALEVLSSFVGDAAVGLVLEYPDGPGEPSGAAVHFAPGSMLDWARKGYFARDPWSESGSFPKAGEVRFCAADREQVERMPFYQEWMKPQGFLPEGMFAATLAGDRREASQTLGFYSRRGGRLLVEEDRAFVDSLLPTIQRAAIASRAVLGLGARPLHFEQTLSALRTPVLHLRSDGLVTWMNAQARELVANREEICVTNGVLQLSGGPEARVFNEALRELGSKGEEGASREVLCGGSDDESPLRIIVADAGSSDEDTAREPVRFRVTIASDPKSEVGDAQRLAQAYGLTPAEAKVAVLLVDGASTREVAAAMSITEGTTRQYLKRIYRKTRAKSQVDLVRLLLSDLSASPRHGE